MQRETFGERLQRLRASAGLTQQQVADKADVPLQTLRNWEHDRREPLASALFKLARALGVSCSVFEIDESASAAPAVKRKKDKNR